MNYPKLIGICGKARSGKTTIDNYLGCKYLYESYPFAEEVKETAYMLFDIDSTTDKTLYLPEWGLTYRSILQQIGSKMREIHPDIWVRYVLDLIEKEKDMHPLTVGYTIPDVRYLNEYNAIRKMDGKMIRVIRTNYQSNLTIDEQSHPSETELDSIPNLAFDLVITAKSGDIQHIYDEIDKWLECTE